MAIQSFVELVRSHQSPGMSVVEVGCWDGETSLSWIPIVQANHGTSFLVDNFHGNPTAVGVHAFCPVRRDDVADALRKKIAIFENVTILDGDSAEMAARVPDKSLDICFIDADHRYSHVSGDIKAWLPKIKPAGIICGHDCEGTSYDEKFVEMDYVKGKHHGVIKAVTEQFGQVKLLGDSCWCVSL